ncbi:Ig-like domain-containing protein [Gammaproteobacteria bacterium]|nr:Ig-like domain-containing protein [Gammaproteobacteria bacterium]
MNKFIISLTTLVFISACGGGGGGMGGGDSTPMTPAPVVSLSASPMSVLLTETSTLTWSSTNATSCSASGSWSGTKTTSGSEAVTISTAGNNTFTLACTGAGGSGSASVTVEGYRNSNGVVVDGYISGAEVFIDEDGDWMLDSNENSTTSDNDGKFTLKYSNGNLVSIGGTDLDSQNLLDNFLITQKLSGHTEFKAITPVTSIAAFMNEPSDINAALGIDPAIDVSIFDPVANKGDGGVNDYLYEKGNQLTVIAYALQNIANNLNTTTETTQDYFQSMAEVIDAEYAETESRVNIETEAFITKALDSVISKKTLTLDDTNKTNTISALTSILPVIQVKANDANTVAIFNFATSTFQSDAQAMASGSATSEVISSYQTDILNYVATDQNLVASELQPDITAIIDSVTTDEDISIDINVLNNDSYLTTTSISVGIDNPSDGTASVSNNIVTYVPDDNFFGTDSISYTISQNEKISSSNISIVINSVNDVPIFDNLLSTYRVDENQTAVTSISASDVEKEALTISLAGTDQSSFNLSSENVLTFNESPDYETKTSYELIISVTDGIDTLDKNVSVNLNNLNDNLPVFTSDSTFSSDENQTSIGNVLVSDADGDSIAYSISGSDIVIDGASGLISFALAPDYETTTSFAATVTATDGLTSITQDITVDINNLNDNSPIFTSDLSFSSDENQTAVGTVTASDADGDSLTYSISGTDLLITTDGVLTFATAPDYETVTSYSATVTTTDGVNSSTQDITANINNLNDNSPIFSSAETFEVEENKTTIGTAVAADADIGSSISYSIDNSVNQKIEVSVAANANGSGNVYVISGVQKKSLFLEVGKTYSFNHPTEHPLRFSTTADGTHGGGSALTEGVDTSTDGVTLITVSADTPTDLYYYCSIHAGMGNDVTASSTGFPVISIAASGALTFKPTPDFEKLASFSAKITASDGEISTDQDIQVEITDVEPEGPVFSTSDVLNADENQTTIGTVSAADPFGAVVTYAISGTDASSITLDTASGELTFNTAPDYETKTSYEVVITAAGTITNTEQVLTINVNNLNDNEPVFSSSATLSGDENQTDIGSVVATDADGDALTYSVTGTNLSITSAGVLTFASAPDYETTTSYTGTVTVTDGLTPLTQDITVNVNNLNDNDPIFTSDATFSANENQIAVGTVTGSDADGDSYTFTISGSELAITSAGVLTLVSAPDYETKTSYTATVTITDGVNSLTQDITVNINDIDDNAPAFTSSASFSADENQTAIGTVIVTDVDTLDTSSSFTFAVSGSELAIDSDGVLTFTSAPDYETKTSYTTTITASDGASNSSTQSITVSINNLNDNSPAFSSGATFSADENQLAIGTVASSDADGDDVTYSINGSEIVINSSSGVISFVADPDYETKTSYTATVTSSDGTNSTTQDITVNVNNLNDNSPVFTSDPTFSAAENQTAIGTVTASDADGNSLSFTVSGSELEITSAGVLNFATAPDYETKASYTATVTLNDGANTTTQDITVNVADINDAPVFTSNETFSADENQTAIGTATGSDQDGNSLSFTVSGSELEITSAGVLTFASAPDYETKSSYTATVSISDSIVTTAQNITVNVSDVNDAPVATAASYGLNLLPQSQTSASTTLAGTDQDGDTLTYAIASNGNYGTASISGSTFSYQTSADTQSAQSDSFTFTANDGTVDSSAATISIDLRTDPLYQYQWHLNNTGQTNFATNAGTAGQDLNVDSVIVDGYTGNGIKISIGDDGLEIAHEDLKDNVISGSYDYENSDNDPTQPSSCPETGSCVGHGTSVAGIIAAKGWNNIGVRGVAPNASIFGDNFLGNSSKYNESRGVNSPGGVTADIYNMSYGVGYPKDDDDEQESTYSLSKSLKYNSTSIFEEAFVNGVTNLRDGKGAIYVKSSGNYYNTQSGSDCGEGKELSCTETSIDRNNQSPYIINVGSINADGVKSSYSSPGSSIWVSGFGGEYGYDSSIYGADSEWTKAQLDPAIMTVDRSSCLLGSSRGEDGETYAGNNRFNIGGYGFSDNETLNSSCNYHSHFNGTSAAAPTIAGVIALILEANSDLTWRDVKHILVTTSDKIDGTRVAEVDSIAQYRWVENTAGHEHHNWYGFGRVNAAAAVSAAKTYTANSLGGYVITDLYLNTINETIPDNSGGAVTQEITKPTGSNGIVEFVRVLIDFDHSEPGTVGFRLQSPGGTIINLMQKGTNINNPAGAFYFDIGASGFYGESMEGTWTLEVRDYSAGTTGTLDNWGIQIHGN